MPKLFHIVVWALGIFAGCSILLVMGLLVFLTLTEFTPANHSVPEIKGNGKNFDPLQRDFTFLTWNIGYAGLGSDQDFFYDGGKSVMPDKEQCARYFDGIKKQVKANDSINFLFLQEIDICAKRSWKTDEVAGLAALLPSFSSVYATNYDCRFVPMPVQNPMGKVVAGLATYSQFRPQKAEVQYYDAFFPWPKRLAFLKRCYVMLRFGLANGKELVIVNTHNSAFDSTGALRKRELAILDSALQSEYQRGNYVVVGGDWNSNPRGFNIASIVTGDQVTNIDPPIEPNFLPGWQFVFDPAKPSNRFLDMSYQKGVNKTTIVDFFVVSPNIEVTHVTTIPMGFAYSDHEPVKMAVRLKE
ncbi:MAG: endonuclease/exonuclease/phosphatase family protein [Bacteroidota bacterium]